MSQQIYCMIVIMVAMVVFANSNAIHAQDITDSAAAEFVKQYETNVVPVEDSPEPGLVGRQYFRGATKPLLARKPSTSR